MRLNRRQFITKASIGAVAFALPAAAKSILGQSKRVKRTPDVFGGHGSQLNAIESGMEEIL